MEEVLDLTRKVFAASWSSCSILESWMHLPLLMSPVTPWWQLFFPQKECQDAILLPINKYIRTLAVISEDAPPVEATLSLSTRAEPPQPPSDHSRSPSAEDVRLGSCRPPQPPLVTQTSGDSSQGSLHPSDISEELGSTSLDNTVTDLVAKHGGPAKVMSHPPEEMLAAHNLHSTDPTPLSSPPLDSEGLLPMTHASGLMALGSGSAPMSEVIGNQGMDVVNNGMDPPPSSAMLHVATDDLGSPMDVVSPLTNMPPNFNHIGVTPRTNPIKGEFHLPSAPHPHTMCSPSSPFLISNVWLWAEVGSHGFVNVLRWLGVVSSCSRLPVMTTLWPFRSWLLCLSVHLIVFFFFGTPFQGQLVAPNPRLLHCPIWKVRPEALSPLLGFLAFLPASANCWELTNSSTCLACIELTISNSM